MNILICTLGTTWQIAAESLGFINYRTFDLYRNHPEKADINEKREIYFKNEANEIWVISTDSEKQKEQFNLLTRWIELTGIDIRATFIPLPGIDDITNEESVIKFAELCYKTVFDARKKVTDREKLYVSIAGGRKTMSSDLLDAVHIFGADVVFHVIDDGKEKGNPPTPEDLVSSPDEYIKHFIPVVTGTYPPQEFIDDIQSDLENQSIYELTKSRQEKAANHYRNFDTADDNFRILYQYKKPVIEALKSRMIGVDPAQRDREFALLHGLPKTDLHCHLGGVLEPEDLRELGRLFINKRPENPADEYKKSLVNALFNENSTAEGLKKIIFGEYADEKKYCGIGIESYEKLGDIQGSTLLQTREIISFTVSRLIEKSLKENVTHIEIRCSPINYTRGGLTGKGVLNVILNSMEKYSDKISASLLIIASRHGKMSDIYRHIELVDEMKNDDLFTKYFRGFDLAGDESKRNPAELRNAFLAVMESCSNITIHAGETVKAKNIWEAVYHLNAERIGHGLTLENDNSLMIKILDRNIGIEMCPSSNFQIVGFRDNYYPESGKYAEYPLKKYLEAGLRVTVNTDNPGISLTNATNELHKAARLTSGGLSLWDIFKIIKNGYKTSFVSHEQRCKLIKQAEKRIEKWIEEHILYER